MSDDFRYARPGRSSMSSQRRMARPLRDEGPLTPRRRLAPRQLIGPAVLTLIGGAALVGVLGLANGAPALTGAVLSPSPVTSPSPLAAPTPTATVGGPATGSSGVGTPRSTPSPRPSANPTPALPSPSPSATPRPRDWAPISAATFDQQGQLIDITFPFKQGTRYRYRDNWLDIRAGTPEAYNHARFRNGEVRRAHDGIDIYARRDSPVVAPFAGTVINPADRWRPWDSRYGTAVVIVSSEPQSAGYAVLLAHLDSSFVQPGTQVRRGEVVGLAGNTGNADSTRVHLHFELRAPFELAWRELGAERMVDAFNPFSSLAAADPKRD